MVILIEVLSVCGNTYFHLRLENFKFVLKKLRLMQIFKREKIYFLFWKENKTKHNHQKLRIHLKMESQPLKKFEGQTKTTDYGYFLLAQCVFSGQKSCKLSNEF